LRAIPQPRKQFAIWPRIISLGSIDLRELSVQHTLGSLTELRRRIEIKDGQISQHCLCGVFVSAQHLDSIGGAVIELARAGKCLLA